MQITNEQLQAMSLKDLTGLYNKVTGRNVKKLSQKSIGIKAISKALKETGQDIEKHIAPEDYVKTSEELASKFIFHTSKGVGEFMRRLIAGEAQPGEEVTGPLDPDFILKMVKTKFNALSKATYSDVAWVKNDLRKKGYKVPIYRKKKEKTK